MSEPVVWWKLSVSAPLPVREAVGSLLVEWGAQGVVEEETAVSAYYPPAQREGLEAMVARYAADAGSSVTWSWEEIRGEDWWESWKKHFRPVQVSRRLGVCPSWEKWVPPTPAVKVIRMDPGRAFGTGTHETTRLCLELLDECLNETPAGSLLDVGSGSGILSIAARLLEVPRVIALDIDPIAAAATRDNGARNQAGSGMLTICGDLRAVRGSYDLVVANILYQVLLGLAPALCERVAPRGRLLLSGMLRKELASAAALYERFGLRVAREAGKGEWGALILTRSSGTRRGTGSER